MQQGCLRCGRTDHVVANCPHVSGNGGKRKVVDLDADSLIGMVFLEGAEQFHEIDEAYHQGESLVKAGGWLSQQPDMCVQDQGASSFITGTEYLLRYLKWLETSGYPMAELSFKRCDKGFAFGGDASGHARWMVELPVFISGNSLRRLQAYVIFGATPMLLGRPILERLQVDVSFGTGRMRILGGEWQEIPRGKQDCMLLRLADGLTGIEQFQNPVFDLRSEDDHEHIQSVTQFLGDIRGHERFAEMTDEVQKLCHTPMHHGDNTATPEKAHFASIDGDNTATPDDFGAGEVQEKSQEQMAKTWRWIESEIRQAERDALALTFMAREHQPERQRLVWEVYAGEGRLSSTLEQSGTVRVMRFGLEDGWDLSRASHRKQLLRLCDELEPDEIFMSPKCTLWSRMQNINIRSEADAEELKMKREIDSQTHLNLCRRLYLKQVQRGLHAHIEHPRDSQAWVQTPLGQLPGHQAIFDQCAYGSTTVGDDGEEWPILKPTRIQTTKWAMLQMMSQRCDGPHAHWPLEGRQRCREAENYQEQLARSIAVAIMHEEGMQEQVYAVSDDPQAAALTGVLRRLATRHGHTVSIAISDIHGRNYSSRC